MEKLELQWHGPFLLDDMDNESFDKVGIYQVYGTHQVYGSDALLYIGQASKQNFRKRLNQEISSTYPWWERTGGRVSFYLGVFEEEKSKKKLEKKIAVAETLLIASHLPSTNSSQIKTASVDKDYLLINWGYYHKLLPEVSTFRWFYD